MSGGRRTGWRAWAISSAGLGFAPVAPGTFGTLGGVALAAAAGYWLPAGFAWACLGMAALVCALGVPLGTWAERHYGRKDPGVFVLDEVAGYLVAVAWPNWPGWPHLVAAFLLFRLTDILKPWPARRLERLPGGWGILVDDLAAGVWAFGLLLLLRQVAPNLFAA